MSRELFPIEGPYEILDLEDGASFTLDITAWERGTMIIRPIRNGVEIEKIIPIIRAHLTPESKPLPPRYYDITSKTLQAQLIPLLSARDFETHVFKVTKYGKGVRARFSLERISKASL